MRLEREQRWERNKGKRKEKIKKRKKAAKFVDKN